MIKNLVISLTQWLSLQIKPTATRWYHMTTICGGLKVTWVGMHAKFFRARITSIFKTAQRFAASHCNTLSAGEFHYLKKFVYLKALPTPQLLIKNQKPKVNSEYPIRLVVPTSNFTAGFVNLGYCGIKHVFDSYGVNYSRFTITQAMD